MDYIMSYENLDLCVRACRPEFPASAHLLVRQADEIETLRAALAASKAKRAELKGLLRRSGVYVWAFAEDCKRSHPEDSMQARKWLEDRDAALRGEEVKG